MVHPGIGSLHTRLPPLGTGATQQSDQPVLVANRLRGLTKDRKGRLLRVDLVEE
jgi:hypothetical protein